MKNRKPTKPIKKLMNCFTKNCAGLTPSYRHFGAVAENIAKNPIMIKNVTTTVNVLSGGDVKTRLLCLDIIFKYVPPFFVTFEHIKTCTSR